MTDVIDTIARERYLDTDGAADPTAAATWWDQDTDDPMVDTIRDEQRREVRRTVAALYRLGYTIARVAHVHREANVGLYFADGLVVYQYHDFPSPGDPLCVVTDVLDETGQQASPDVALTGTPGSGRR